ncbi:hypothetical protein FGB62_112g08 [Gracilaria domingensis]|nr:hypothetical protein FGB62_112g08 [Gracilaria domingensis]
MADAPPTADALETMHAILLALHRRDAQAKRPSPPVNLRDERRAFLLQVFNRTVGARLPVTVGGRARHAQRAAATPDAVTPDDEHALQNDAPPPAKRARRAAAPKEVRGARFRSAPPRSTLDRYRRSNIRLYLVARKRVAHDVAFLLSWASTAPSTTCTSRCSPNAIVRTL